MCSERERDDLAVEDAASLRASPAAGVALERPGLGLGVLRRDALGLGAADDLRADATAAIAEPGVRRRGNRDQRQRSQRREQEETNVPDRHVLRIGDLA